MSATPDSCIHLTVDIVKEIHGMVLAEFGGSGGIRDEGLLHSAVAAPQATYGGESPFSDLPEVAAAYLFYICRNHPFIDGNKRTALVVSRTFLLLNGFNINASQEEKYLTFLKLAEGKIDEEELTKWFRGKLVEIE